MAIEGKQIAQAPDGIDTGNLNDGAVTELKLDPALAGGLVHTPMTQVLNCAGFALNNVPNPAGPGTTDGASCVYAETKAGDALIAANVYTDFWTPAAKLMCSAEVLAGLAAVASYVPVGYGATTSLLATVGGIVMATNTGLVSFYVRHRGSLANIGGQTVTYDLLRNGGIVGSVVLDANAGGLTVDGDVGAVTPIGFKNLLQVRATPSAALTASVSEIMAAAV